MKNSILTSAVKAFHRGENHHCIRHEALLEVLSRKRYAPKIGQHLKEIDRQLLIRLSVKVK